VSKTFKPKKRWNHVDPIKERSTVGHDEELTFIIYPLLLKIPSIHIVHEGFFDITITLRDFKVLEYIATDECARPPLKKWDLLPTDLIQRFLIKMKEDIGTSIGSSPYTQKEFIVSIWNLNNPSSRIRIKELNWARYE
jgi:hypothetical protein